VQKLGPLRRACWCVAAAAAAVVRGGPGPDQLQDEGAPGADVRAPGQEVPADLEKGERGEEGRVCEFSGAARPCLFLLWRGVRGVGVRAGRATARQFLQKDTTHQRLQHARLARALRTDDSDLGQVDAQVQVDLCGVVRGGGMIPKKKK
jgi:hypothetical protein